MFLLFDCETSGMPSFKKPADDPSQPRIVQLAALLVDENLDPMTLDGEPAEFCSIVKPDGWEIHPGAEKAHGISLARAHREGVPISAVMDSFDRLWDACEVAAAFNLRFDMKFIRGERRRLGRPDGFGDKRILDPMPFCSGVCKIPATEKMVRYGRGKQFKTPKLEEAHRIICGHEMANAHDAMADVQALHRILIALRDDHGYDLSGIDQESTKTPAEQGDLLAATKPLTKDDLEIL